MKSLNNTKVLLAGLMLIICFYACRKDPMPAAKQSNVSPVSLAAKQLTIKQVNLVADTAGFGAARIDVNLVNAWGIAASPTGILWLSANHTGLSTIYDKMGQTVRPPVTIPSPVAGQAGAPTGVIFNNTSDFGANKFLFASEDGIIAAWVPSLGNSAVIVANRSSFGTVYKGITMAADGTDNFLYLTDFKGGKIDVFDRNFNYVTSKPFHDPSIPPDFAPFNIQNIGGKLYVTYAKHKAPDNMDDQKGPGNGYVDIFNPDGTFVKRFASRGDLNSPWGIALAPAGFAASYETILIGNFGDGRINVFDINGNCKGHLMCQGKVITIDGLWAIDFLKNNLPGGNATDPLYFTAGPAEESHGLFGYLQKQ